jgi:hypothetical protein
MFYYIGYHKLSILNQVRVPQFFQRPKGCRELKRFKKAAIAKQKFLISILVFAGNPAGYTTAGTCTYTFTATSGKNF